MIISRQNTRLISQFLLSLLMAASLQTVRTEVGHPCTTTDLINCTSGEECAINNTCTCMNGYTSNGTFCLANLNSSCITTIGCSSPYADCLSGTCHCRIGYTNVGDLCKADFVSTCDTVNGCFNPYADCVSGSCQCKTGYTKVGNFCKADNRYPCTVQNGCNSQYASCTAGSCVCNSGYIDSNGGSQAGGICKPELGYACNLNSPQVCNDGNATCNGTSDTCLCNSDYYNSSGVCKLLSLLKVKQLGISNTGEDFLEVHWENPDNVVDVSSFSITRKRRTEISSPLNVSKNLTATLKNLTAGAAYIIQINSFYGTILGATVELQQATKPYKPGPLNLVNSSLDLAFNVLTLVWNYAGASNGADVVYKVELIDSNASAGIVRSFPSLTTRNVSTNANGLRNGYKYVVNITAKSEVFVQGSESRVDSAIYTELVKTVPKDPNPPTVVQCSDITDTSIKISWQHPIEPNGDIQQYVVKTYIYRQENVQIMTTNTTSPSENFVVTGLEPGKYYRFRVFTQNELSLEQTGNWSQEEYCQTIANMSGPPVNLTQIVISSRSFTLAWNQPDNVNGELLGYVLTITKNETSECVIIEYTVCNSGCTGFFPNVTVNQPTCNQNMTYRTNQTELRTRTRIFTSSLTPDTVYKVSVAAVNQASNGRTALLYVTTQEEDMEINL